MTDAMSAKKPVTTALKPMQRNDRYGGVGVDSYGHVTQFSLKTGTRWSTEAITCLIPKR